MAAGMASEHRLDAKVAGKVIPKRLAAADEDPGQEMLGRDAAITGKARKKSKSSMREKMVVLAAVIEVCFASLHCA